MKKQFLIGLVASSIIFSGVSTFAKTETPDLLINPIKAEVELINEDGLGQESILEGVETYKKGNTEMVPLRQVAEEKLGLKVLWKNEDRSVEVGEGPQWTSVKIGENSYFYGRTAPFKLSQAPEIKDGLTYVPVEFFTEVLRYNISSDDEDSQDEERILDGFIKEVNREDGGKSLLVAGNEWTKGVDEILLHVSDGTVIVDKDGKSVSFDDLRAGTKIKAVLPEIMTMSLPPQGAAIKIIVEDRSVEIIKIEDENNKDIVYYEIKGIEEASINEKIKDFVKDLEENEIYKDLKLDSEISFLNDDKISMVFRGSYEFNNSEKYLVKSLNLDLKTGNEITFESYFKDDEDSQGKLEEILNKQGKEQGQTEFEAEGRWIKFKGSNVIVFYYPLDDSVIYPTELYIPLEDVKDLIK